MKTGVLPAFHPTAIAHALDVLQHGGLVAFPTDTVYGLASPAFDAENVERLYIAKGRSNDKAIALLLSEAAQLSKVARNLGKTAMKLARHFWPGPLTLVVSRHPNVPDAVSSLPTVGVRIPDHPIALALLNLSGPLAVTSANLAGKMSPTTAKGVLAQLDSRIHLVLDGGTSPGGTPSTVVDCTTPDPVILRPGPLSMSDLQKALNSQKIPAQEL